MSATPEQLARVQDPSTSATELQALAAAEPELWPAIVGHPNVYPDLVAWIRASTPAEHAVTTPLETTPLEYAPTEVLTPAVTPAAAARAPFDFAAWVKRRSRVLIISGAGVVAAILAVVLVMTLVVAPQQRAAEEAAAAAAALDKATQHFDTAVTRCERSNDTLASSLATAEKQVAADPSTLDDPSMIPALQSKIDEVSPTEPCVAPAMAGEAADIEKQTVKLEQESDRVDFAEGGLTTAIQHVLDSIAAKESADAAAAAEVERQQQAALLAARTWTLTDSNGYTFTAAIDVSAPTTSGTFRDTEIGAACSFDPSTDIAVPVKMTVTATTEGFDTSIAAVINLRQYGSSQPHEVEIEAYYSAGPECKTQSYGNLTDSVQWPDPFAKGSSGAHQFVVIIRDWKTPSTPSGDTAFLGLLRMSVSGGSGTTYFTSENKSVDLTNQPR